MKLITTLFVLVLCLASIAYGSDEKSFEDLFHMAPQAAEKLYGKETFQRLKKAADDFNAVLTGKPPRHAKKDKKHPLPADGGTKYFVGDGYKLTVVMSLNGVKRGDKYFRGYMYGPELTFNEDLLSGNRPRINHVTFYPSEQLMKLLERNETLQEAK